jgi:hypothetical protein
LCTGRGSYLTPYTFTDGTPASLAVVATLVPDKSRKRRRKWLLYIVIHLDWSPDKIYVNYRRRFGISVVIACCAEFALPPLLTILLCAFFS